MHQTGEKIIVTMPSEHLGRLKMSYYTLEKATCRQLPMCTYFLMTLHAQFHQCIPPVAHAHHRKARFPPFCVLVHLSYLVLREGKSSIIDRVLNSALSPPPIFEAAATPAVTCCCCCCCCCCIAAVIVIASATCCCCCGCLYCCFCGRQSLLLLRVLLLLLVFLSYLLLLLLLLLLHCCFCCCCCHCCYVVVLVNVANC